MNLYNYVHSTDTIFLRMYKLCTSMYTSFKEYIQFCTFNVHNFTKIVLNSVSSIHTIFQKCTKFYTFNVNNSMHTINALIFREEGE